MTSVLYDAPGPKAIRRARILGIVGVLLMLAGLGYVIYILARPREVSETVTQPGLFDSSRWDIFVDPVLWAAIWRGVWATLSAAGVAAVLAILIGIVFALLGSALSPWVRVPTTVVLEFFRGMPVLLMMLFLLLIVFNGAPFWAVVAALAVYNGALIGEMLRAGICSLPRGQREAGLTIGLTSLRTRFSIEFPQAFKQMTPIIVAQLVVLLKDTSLGYIISYEEILRTNMNFLTNFYGNRYFFSFFFVTIVIYLGINMSVSWFAKYLSRRMTASQQQHGKGKPGGPPEAANLPGMEPLPPATSVITTHTGK